LANAVIMLQCSRRISTSLNQYQADRNACASDQATCAHP
jgi:hypothetical protein